MLIFPKEVVDIELQSEPELEQELTRKNFQLNISTFIIGREYNDAIQRNTCSLENFPAILSLFKNNIIDSNIITGIPQSENKFQPIMSPINEFNFDKLRHFIAKAIGLNIQ